MTDLPNRDDAPLNLNKPSPWSDPNTDVIGQVQAEIARIKDDYVSGRDDQRWADAQARLGERIAAFREANGITATTPVRVNMPPLVLKGILDRATTAARDFIDSIVRVNAVVTSHGDAFARLAAAMRENAEPMRQAERNLGRYQRRIPKTTPSRRNKHGRKGVHQ